MTDFTCPMRVIPGGAVEGKTLSAAGLRGLPGLFLTAVQTGEETDAVAAPGPEYVLRGGDVLWFAGDAAGVSRRQEAFGRHYATRGAGSSGAAVTV